MYETAAEKVLRIFGAPERTAVWCAFERFRGMDAKRQISANLIKILLPLLHDEGDTYLNSGTMCVLLHTSEQLCTRNQLQYAKTRGGIWNIVDIDEPPWVKVQTASPMYNPDPFGISEPYTPDYKIVGIRINHDNKSIVTNLIVEVKPCENKISKEVWKKCENMAMVQGEYMALFYGTITSPMQSMRSKSGEYANTGGLRAFLWEPHNPKPTDNWVFMKDFDSNMPFIGRLVDSNEQRHAHPRLIEAYNRANNA
eukprot:2357728-Prymnesium_polylepis.1